MTEGERSSLDRAIGRLEAAADAFKDRTKELKEDFNKKIEELKRDLKASDESAGRYRHDMRTQLQSIDDKIDPMKVEINALGLDVKANAATVASMATRVAAIEDTHKDFQRAARVGRWIFRTLWLIGGTIAIAWADRIKSPFASLLKFWKGV